MEVYGLIGDPVDHSASPALFDAAFEATDIDACYVTFPVRASALSTAIAGAAALGIEGLNVTTPHKTAILEYVEPDVTAERVGAVNTIAFDDDPPRATNTDARGFERLLMDLDLTPGRALVLGAGGAAHAYTDALQSAGWSMTIANRTPAAARRLAAGRRQASGMPLEAAGAIAPEVDLIVNATTVGMGEPSQSPLPSGVIDADHTVIDAVYDPLETALLRDARAVGATTVDGHRLLLEQAVAAFSFWHGDNPPREAMAAALSSGAP